MLAEVTRKQRTRVDSQCPTHQWCDFEQVSILCVPRESLWHIWHDIWQASQQSCLLFMLILLDLCHSQPWSERFLFMWQLISAETHNWSVLRPSGHECLALSETSTSAFLHPHPTPGLGCSTGEGTERMREPEMGRRAVKHTPGDVTQSLPSRELSCRRYLWSSVQDRSSQHSSISSMQEWFTSPNP